MGSISYFRSPYTSQVVSPFGPPYARIRGNSYYQTFSTPRPEYHIQSLHQTIKLNNRLNGEAQAAVDALEPKTNIWEKRDEQSQMVGMMGEMSMNGGGKGEKGEKTRSSYNPPPGLPSALKSQLKEAPKRSSGLFSKIFKTEPKDVAEARKNGELASAILEEEYGRWPDELTRAIVDTYQQKTGMKTKIAHLRSAQPLQYLHLLRGTFTLSTIIKSLTNFLYVFFLPQLAFSNPSLRTGQIRPAILSSSLLKLQEVGGVSRLLGEVSKIQVR